MATGPRAHFMAFHFMFVYETESCVKAWRGSQTYHMGAYTFPHACHIYIKCALKREMGRLF